MIVFNTAFSQTFRNGFDNYESGLGGGYGQGLSYHSNVAGELNNGESIYLQSYLNMFKATKDKRYLDKFIIHSKRVQERRDDNITLLPFTQLEGFPAKFYDSNGNFICQIDGVSQVDPNSQAWSTVENIYDQHNHPDCQYNTQRVLHSAALTFPMAEFVYFMKTDPDFMNVANEPVPTEAQGFYPNINPYYNIQSYHDYAVWLKSKVTETIQYHECFWQTAYYVHHCGSNDIDALNMQCAMGKTLIMMYLVSVAEGNPNYTYFYHITDIALLLRGQLQSNSQDNTSYTWCHTYDCMCDHHPGIEDIAHAHLVMSFADLCHQYNQYIYNAYNSQKLFYSTDMQMFANTFVKHIYQQSPGHYAANTFGTNDNTCNSTHPDNIGAYVFLTKYNPYVYHIIADRFQGRAIYNLGGDLMGLSQLALYQKKILNSSSFNNPRSYLFNPIGLLDGALVGGAGMLPLAGNQWISAATGDFDGDGEQEFAAIHNNASYTNAGIKAYKKQTCNFNPNLSNCITELSSTSLASFPWIKLIAGDFNPQHPGDELIGVNIHYIKEMEVSNNQLNAGGVTGFAFPFWQDAIAADFFTNYPGDEIMLINTDGDIYILYYNVNTQSFQTLWNTHDSFLSSVPPDGIIRGNFDGTSSKEFAVLMKNTNQIIVWKWLPNNTLLWTPYQYTFNFTPKGITAGDFDGDGIDEIITYSPQDGKFLILKIKSGQLQIVGEEYFPPSQQHGIMCSLHFNTYFDRDALVTFRNADKQIVIYDMDGMCSNLYLNNQIIDDNYTINNIYTNTNNNYVVDYHANNTLFASNVKVQSPSKVVFAAGKKIVVSGASGSSSKVNAGTYFHAYIDPSLSCGNNEYFRMQNANSYVPVQSYNHYTSDIVRALSKSDTNTLFHCNAITFPNPASSSINIQTTDNSHIQTILLKDLTGKVLLQQNFSPPSTIVSIEVSALSNGLYLTEIHTSSSIVTEKVVVQR
ncbi:MAG: hypothetical protein Fur0023_22380 [Bacteroidia bacterium]